jgi:predicted  nucleic acid-binding Zn-ribbon protein
MKLTSSVVLFSLVKASAEEPAAEGNDKTAAVDKVIEMLEGLSKTVQEEGGKEAKTYNTFACFCKDTIKDKTKSIQTGEDEKSSLSASIQETQSERADLDDKITGLLGDIQEAEKTIKKAKDKRKKELAIYEAAEADLSGAISALKGAIDVLKGSKPSLVQLQSVDETFKYYTLMANAMGLSSDDVQKNSAAFLQQTGSLGPDIEMKDYEFHSGDIVKSLEKLLTDFKAQKVEVDEAETKSVEEHEALVQEQEDIIKEKNTDLDKARKDKDEKQAKIAEDSTQLTTVAATVLDDQQYLQELAQMCQVKAVTWDQRSKIRADELSALTSAIAIIKEKVGEATSKATIRFAQQGVAVKLAEKVARSPAAMENMEAEAEAEEQGSLSFLQEASGFLSPVKKVALVKTSVQEKGPQAAEVGARKALEAILRSSALRTKSTEMTVLAGKVMEDPMAKVKILIQELIERLLKEAANEANQKGWCDKSLSDAKQKRDYAAEEIASHNANMAELEATRDKLNMELDTLHEEMVKLNETRAEAEELRTEEKAENEETVTVAGEGLEAVNMAIDILDKFYKTAANSEVELSLAQQGPLGNDAPDAGFDSGEAYKGAGGSAGGIIGMLEVIQSDFERTIKETEKAEAKAAQDHYVFMTDTGVSLGEKQTATKEKKRQLSDTEDALAEAEEGLKSEVDLINNAITELLELQPACVNTGMTDEERKEARQGEIDALHKGLCILENMADYGPGGSGAGDKC